MVTTGMRAISMPVPAFGSFFSGLANDTKLTDEVLVRDIRFMVAAEYEAIQLYMQLAPDEEKLYAPPNHRDGVIHHTRAEAEKDNEHFDGKATE
jgi:hypothetical protein